MMNQLFGQFSFSLLAIGGPAALIKHSLVDPMDC